MTRWTFEIVKVDSSIHYFDLVLSLCNTIFISRDRERERGATGWSAVKSVLLPLRASSIRPETEGGSVKCWLL